ncbi:hypothetical protein BS78_06G244600 [Paspalum vaginatum]|nr:hypothetical protein BS78_06G244600 [Paspalum vaginatum]
MLDQTNPLVKVFRHAHDLLEEHNGIDVSIRIIGAKKGDRVQYEMPHGEELAILIVGDMSLENYKRDIIVSTQRKGLRRISIFHPAYMPLQYPLLFPYGERGFQLGIKYNKNNCDKNKNNGKCDTITPHEFFKFHMHYRPNQPNPYLCYGRLSKQAIVDARAMEDEDRLDYISRNQTKLRAEYIQGIFDAVEKGMYEANQIGEQPNDRSDIIVRVFHMKLEQILDDLQSGVIFGPILAILYSIEFQKRGFPHVHILVWIEKKGNEITSEIDSWISAEIPDPVIDPLGYILVAEHMMHGPCGDKNWNCPCMKKGRSSKFYPKEFQESTRFTDTGFTLYRRTNNTIFIRRDQHNLDNRWVVPHNLKLLKRYQAHINVEYVNKSKVLKYLCKYVTKGPNQAKIIFQRIKKGQDAPMNDETNTIDEIKEYLDCRYICEQDALWRLLGFEIHYHWPPVERLPVHLPSMNIVKMKSNEKLIDITKDPKNMKTMLTGWFDTNKKYEEARDLTYCEFPKKWLWDVNKREWKRRKHGFKIGRLYYVNPTEGERFYLRMLLMIVKGAQSYEDIRTCNGVVYQTFKEACAARGLLSDDKEWYNTFEEAANWATSSQLRNLFVIMITYCEIKDEREFFNIAWSKMIDDIEKQLASKYYPAKYTPSQNELQDLLLAELDDIFSKNGQQMAHYNLPQRSISHGIDTNNRLIQEEMNYDVQYLEEQANKLYSQLNIDQIQAFHEIVNSVLHNSPEFYFVHGHGGTSKTFLWNSIVSYLRAQKRIVLTVASSGVASLLLPNGRTAHSRFRIPVDIDELSMCDIKRGTTLAKLLIETSLIIWDEALMTNKQCFA